MSIEDLTQKLKDGITKVGWSVLGVAGETTATSFAYTIGLSATLNHPDIIVFGLPRNVAMELLNRIGFTIKERGSIVTNERIKGLLSADIFLVPADPNKVAEYVLATRKIYPDMPLHYLQCFWPDLKNVMPWEPNCEELALTQPNLQAPVIDV